MVAPTDEQSKHVSPLAIISRVLFFVYTVAAIIIAGILIHLSVLPLKYLIPVLAALAIPIIVCGFFVFKKSSQKLAHILCIIFESILTIALGLVFFYLGHTIGFFDSIKAADYQIEEYAVLVQKDSNFATLDDLASHTIAIYDDHSDNYQTALTELKEKININEVAYQNLSEAVNAIVTGGTDSLFIKSSLIEIATEVFPNFKSENFRTLDTIQIKTTIETIATTNVDVTKDPFNILISGIDTFGDISTVSRSDVNIVITVNPRTHTILLTTIPRDYEVQLHGTTGIKDKLTHAGLYGINMSIQTIEDLLDIDINYYFRINFDSTVNFIDAIGGIEITPDITFYRPKYNCYFEEGVTIHLEGYCALTYARERKAYGLGDLHRIQNQQDIIDAVITKLTTSKAILSNYTGILASLSGSVETNVPSEQIYRLINMQLDSMPSWKVERTTVNGTEIHVPTYTIPDQILFVFQQNPDSIAAASAKIHEVLAAE